MLSILGGAIGIGVGAAILSVAPSLIPQGLLPAAVTLTFDCASSRSAPARRCSSAAVRHRARVAGDEHLVAGGDGRRQPDHDGRRRADARAAGDGRSRDGGAAALRRRAAAAHAGRGRIVRSRLPRRERAVDAGRSARLEVSDPQALQQFYDQVEAEIRAVPGVAGRRRGPARCRSTTSTDGGFVVRDRRRSAGRGEPAAAHRISGGQPHLLLDARSAGRRWPRLR